MTKPTGAIAQDVTFQSLLTPILQQMGRQPRFWGKLLGTLLVLLGTVALEIPASPVLASVVCTTMRSGDRGDAVKALQQTLNNNGYNVGTPDGVFGDLTGIQVIRFQRDKGLDPDGVVGDSTCAALIKLQKSELVAVASQAPTPSPKPSPAAPSPSPSPKPSTDRILKKNDTGADVIVLQNALRARGFIDLVVTGTFDQATENTVRRLQTLEGLPVTGVIDHTTKDRLNAAIKPQTTAGTTTGSVSPPPANPAPAAQSFPVSSMPAAGQPVVFAKSRPAAVSSSSNGLYIVAVPIRSHDTLAEVRLFVPKAIAQREGRGDFVNAGGYRNRFDAESLSNELKARGFDARVYTP